MMTPGALRKKLVEQFAAANLFDSLDLTESTFQELPRLFEVSHLSMRVVISDFSALPTASRIAATMKRDLSQQGVELEYGITVRTADCHALSRSAGA